METGIGIFRSVKNNWRKSEAAVVVQNLLEMQKKNGLFDENPHLIANEIVQTTWEKSVHVPDGRYGQRPGKISLAAVSLANSLDDESTKDELKVILAMCLGVILQTVQAKGDLMPFNTLDHKLLDIASRIFSQFSEAFEASPLCQEIDELMSASNLAS